MPADTNRKPSPALPGVRLAELRQIRPKEYLLRFVLGATISIVAALLSSTFSARFGGAFLAFPSILPASLTLIQKEEGTRRADRNAVGAVLGSAGLFVFAMIGEAAFSRIEPFVAVLLALAGWAVTSLALYALLAYLRPESCDRDQD
ncbi:MAG TPA: DUF3147 family protein [Trebonia sp.]|nr:DUF3147 family protein [Trebonia sp.]